MKFVSLILIALFFTSHSYAENDLTPTEVNALLGRHKVLMCDVANQDLKIQVQFDGPRSEWVIWFFRDGLVTSSQRISSASVVQLEGMSFLNEFSLRLERGTQVHLTLNEKGIGEATLVGQIKSYQMHCTPKFR